MNCKSSGRNYRHKHVELVDQESITRLIPLGWINYFSSSINIGKEVVYPYRQISSGKVSRDSCAV